MQRDPTVFSDYLRALGRDEEPADAPFEAVWSALRKLVRAGLRKRGLLDKSPSLLGIVGARSWEPGPAGADALDELTADAYTFVFIDRLEAMLRQLAVRPQVEGIVRLNVGHFLHERMQQLDPLGNRLYGVLRDAIGLLVDGAVVTVEGSSKLGRSSVVRFAAATDDVAPADPEALAKAVATWLDDLLPALVVTTGRGYAPMTHRLAAHLAELASAGIAAFRFPELLAPLRTELRYRWTGADEGGDRFEAVLPGMTVLPTPDQAYAARRGFHELVDCVRRRIHELGARHRDRALLEALWRILAHAAVDPESPASGAASMPSRRQLARDLAISRDRLSTLYEMVKRFARACREEASPRTAEGSDMPRTPDDGSARSFDDLKRTLRDQSQRAARRTPDAHQAGTTPPRPGRLYTLASGPACDWVVLDRAPQGLIAVPADTLPVLGPVDIAIDPAEPAGPASLRPALAIVLPRSAFASAHPGPRLSEADLGRLRVAVENARAAPTANAGDDPDLDDWLNELRAASAPLAARSATEDDTPPTPLTVVPGPADPAPALSRPRRSATWLALAAAGAGVALGVGLTRLATPDRPAEPTLEARSRSIDLADVPRGVEDVRFPADAPARRLTLFLPTERPCDTLTVSLFDTQGNRQWQKALRTAPGEDEIYLRLPRDYLQLGTARLRIEATCAGRSELLAERDLRLIADP